MLYLMLTDINENSPWFLLMFNCLCIFTRKINQDFLFKGTHHFDDWARTLIFYVKQFSKLNQSCFVIFCCWVFVTVKMCTWRFIWCFLVTGRLTDRQTRRHIVCTFQFLHLSVSFPPISPTHCTCFSFHCFCLYPCNSVWLSQNAYLCVPCIHSSLFPTLSPISLTPRSFSVKDAISPFKSTTI